MNTLLLLFLISANGHPVSVTWPTQFKDVAACTAYAEKMRYQYILLRPTMDYTSKFSYACVGEE